MQRALRCAGPLALACLIACLFGPVGSAAAGPPAQHARGGCEIHFVASSTLHDFSGDAEARPFAMERHVDASDGREWWSGSVEVAVADLDTGIERRDRSMRAMFDAERFPLIVAELRRVESAAFAEPRRGGEGELDFLLTIRDVQRPVTARVSNWAADARHASFDAEFEVSLASFELEAPAVMGLIRVGDVVSVRAHVTLELPPGILGIGS